MYANICDYLVGHLDCVKQLFQKVQSEAASFGAILNWNTSNGPAAFGFSFFSFFVVVVVETNRILPLV